MKRVTVLISGNGSNLQALIDAQSSIYSIIKVISNKPSAYGLVRAEKANIATSIVIKRKEQTREEYDALLANEIGETDLVVCAGFMRILTDVMISKFLIINLHPALSFGYIGLHAIQRAYSDFLTQKINYSGVIVHYVSLEVDRGQLIEEAVVPIYPCDSLEMLECRIHTAEHVLIVKAVNKILSV